MSKALSDPFLRLFVHVSLYVFSPLSFCKQLSYYLHRSDSILKASQSLGSSKMCSEHFYSQKYDEYINQNAGFPVLLAPVS